MVRKITIIFLTLVIIAMTVHGKPGVANKKSKNKDVEAKTEDKGTGQSKGYEAKNKRSKSKNKKMKKKPKKPMGKSKSKKNKKITKKNKKGYRINSFGKPNFGEPTVAPTKAPLPTLTSIKTFPNPTNPNGPGRPIKTGNKRIVTSSNPTGGPGRPIKTGTKRVVTSSNPTGGPGRPIKTGRR